MPKERDLKQPIEAPESKLNPPGDLAPTREIKIFSEPKLENFHSDFPDLLSRTRGVTTVDLQEKFMQWNLGFFDRVE